jgi:hypothetical protein
VLGERGILVSVSGIQTQNITEDKTMVKDSVSAKAHSAKGKPHHNNKIVYSEQDEKEHVIKITSQESQFIRFLHKHDDWH